MVAHMSSIWGALMGSPEFNPCPQQNQIKQGKKKKTLKTRYDGKA